MLITTIDGKPRYPKIRKPRDAGAQLACWSPELGVMIVNRAHSHEGPTPVYQRVPFRAADPAYLSVPQRTNPGRFFPRRVFYLTPADITLEVIHRQKHLLPINRNGHNAIAEDDRPSAALRKMAPFSYFSKGAPITDPTIVLHQGRIIYHHQRTMRDRVGILLRGKSGGPLFKTEDELQIFRGMRNREIVTRAWQEHVIKVTLEAEFLEDRLRGTDKEKPKGYSAALQKRLWKNARTESLRNGKKNRKKRYIKARDVPPMYSELIEFFNLAEPCPIANIPLVADFTHCTEFNYHATGKPLSAYTPRPVDILPSVMNHYALFIRALTMEVNAHMEEVLIEAAEHPYVFNARIQDENPITAGGMQGAIERYGYRTERFRRFMDAIADNLNLGSVPLGQYATAWTNMLRLHSPVVGGGSSSRAKTPAEFMEDYFIYYGNGSAETMIKRLENSIHPDPVYRYLEKRVMMRYKAEVRAFGLAAPATPLGDYLTLSKPYKKIWQDIEQHF